MYKEVVETLLLRPFSSPTTGECQTQPAAHRANVTIILGIIYGVKCCSFILFVLQSMLLIFF